ncbi:hypothetical protein [Gorillibacterium massiliense]|uniref:hypothetical protein n=1 Tax=Gorillibacterium massiliense TaxID=1280390 RepID=UPI0004BC03AF|nr:hypothetical protein [Gorillibacterium massiliense]
MSIKITEAVYRKKNADGTELVLYLGPSDLDKESYESIYRDHLFCPHPKCMAKLIFVSGNVQVNHFRTWRKSETEPLKGLHIEGCPNGIEQEESERSRRRRDPSYKYNISDEHMSSVLSRAYRAFLQKQQSYGPLKGGGVVKPDGVGGGKIDTTLSPTGTSALFGEGEDVTEGREPPIPVRKIENIDDKDIGKVRCIVGEVLKFYWDEEKKYAYINLKTKNSKKVKVHFNERFEANNRPQFRLFGFLNDYIKHLEKNNTPIICCCIGELNMNKSGIDARPDRYSAFSINNKKLYAIVHEVRGSVN